MVWVGDKVGGEPGIMNASFVREWLDYYIDNDYTARLILYDTVDNIGGAQCGTTTWNNGSIKKQQGAFYVVAGFGAFKITGYRLSHGNGSAVTRDSTNPDWQPQNCKDFPSQDGQCCYHWEECGEPPNDNCSFYCTDWDECDYETGDVNRITGVYRAWTEDTYETCDAAGNFLAPRLFK
jgi:hypothetical protein